MDLVINTIDNTDPIFRELTDLFARMDEAYTRTADRFGFQCRGCRDNCCETRFYHHTLVEVLYLRKGLAALPPQDQAAVMEKAADVLEQTLEQTRQGNGHGDARRIMCPLNHDQHCRIYSHRPMICRLHGVPHQLRRPDGQRQTGPGCADFEKRCGNPRTGLLDRTPFYYALSQLEQKLRQQTGMNQKIKLTVAEILALDI